MMHIREAIKEYPQLEALLRPEFEDGAWEILMKYGEGSRFLYGIPGVNIVLEDDIDFEKPVEFEKEEKENPFTSPADLTYFIINK